QDLLGRPVAPVGLSIWSSLVDFGVPRNVIVSSILGTTEYHVKIIQDLYLKLLGRPADQIGLAGFVGFMRFGASEEQVEALIMNSQEYYQRAGGTAAGYVNALYHDVLGRAADPVGQSIFTQQLAAGFTNATVAFEFLTSQEAKENQAGGFFQRYLHRPLDADTRANYA